MDVLRGTLAGVGGISGTMQTAGGLNAQLGVPKTPPQYQGEYTVTPSQQTQTLNTAGRTLAENITINPIPQNYGLITYNGGIITVS